MTDGTTFAFPVIDPANEAAYPGLTKREYLAAAVTMLPGEEEISLAATRELLGLPPQKDHTTIETWELCIAFEAWLRVKKADAIIAELNK